ncbi:glycosyltransferase [bacterium]|nr:glycosyltransferase [bacterium]
MELSHIVPFVDIVGSGETRRYSSGKIEHRHPHGYSMRSRAIAALRTVVFRSHYFKEKFITPRFCSAIESALRSASYGTLIGSYIVSYDALKPHVNPSQLVVLLTHNDEFVWFENLKNAAGNAISRLVASTSLSFLRNWFNEERPGVIYAHVSEKDKQGYAQLLPDSESIVVPIGADIPEAPVPATSPGSLKATLLFVGSLGIKMNGDALQHFETVFAPVLSKRIPLNVIVAGSNPSQIVMDLCQRNNWSLQANVSDEALRALFERSDFAFLPFEYSTGSKLKLIGTLAHGVPFLATSAVAPPTELIVPPSLVSDNPEAWADAIQQTMEAGISTNQRNALYEAAKQHSWSRSVEIMIQQLS